jgi:ribosome-binding protein aMBF1 (putative translation factor)
MSRDASQHDQGVDHDTVRLQAGHAVAQRTRDPLLVGLGEAIRELRAERDDISQEGLYLETGVHRNYIGGIERAERKPTVEKIAKLAAGLASVCSGVEAMRL